MAKDAFAAEDELDTSFDTSGTTADDLNSGGVVVKECHAHLVVANVKKEAKEGKVPCLVFDMQVLADDAGQKGKFVFHRINLFKGIYKEVDKKNVLIDKEPLSEGALKSLLKFALGLELIAPEDIGKKDLKIPWSKAPGKHCMSHLRHGSDYEKDGEKKKGQIGIQFGEVFPLSDERVKDWPRDTEAATGTNLDDF